MKTAVIIPYFQRQPGVLRRALSSVAGQRGNIVSHVFVVDDESPVPAANDCTGVESETLKITIIRQKNRGPAGARNAGLDAVPDDCPYIAFLDSDDEWAPCHLENAVIALELGHDFYFANFLHLNQKLGAFERAGRIDPAKHTRLSSGRALYRYEGDLFNQTVTGNVIGTSTVVVRSTLVEGIRFRERFTYAGEDYLFWLDCSLRTRAVAFSADVECTYGRGVNVFSGSGWGTPNSLDRIVDETRYRRAILHDYALTPAQRMHLHELLRQNRRAFADDVVHRLAHRKPLRRALLRAQFASDPMSALSFLSWPLRRLLSRS